MMRKKCDEMSKDCLNAMSAVCHIRVDRLKDIEEKKELHKLESDVALIKKEAADANEILVKKNEETHFLHANVVEEERKVKDTHFQLKQASTTIVELKEVVEEN